MSLNYNLTNIPDHESICYREINGETHLAPLTTSLIFSTMLIDMDSITEENAVEFLARCEMAARIYDAFLQMQNTDTGEIINKHYTLEMIRSHIGLKTNANNYTRKQWLKDLPKRIEAEMNRIIYSATRTETVPSYEPMRLVPHEDSLL